MTKEDLTRLATEVKEGCGDADYLLMCWSKEVMLAAWTRSRTISTEDSEDLKQEILIDLWSRIREFDPKKANFATWAGWRARAIIKAYLQKEIRKDRPFLFCNRDTGKHYGEVLSSDIVTIDGAPAEDCTEITFQNFVEEVRVSLQRDLERAPMGNYNRDLMIRTFDLLAEDKTKREVAKELHIPIKKVHYNIRRIRRAILAMEAVA